VRHNDATDAVTARRIDQIRMLVGTQALDMLGTARPDDQTEPGVGATDGNQPGAQPGACHLRSHVADPS
jgi:hypothetical protein